MLVLSDVVEGWVLRLEVCMGLRWLLALPSSLTNQGSQSVGVPDGSRLLD